MIPLRESTLIPVLFLLAVLFLFATASAGQTIAVISPENSKLDQKVADKLAKDLAEREKVLDREMSEAAFRSFSLKNPLNLDVETASNVGAAIGCRFYVLVKAGVQRRSKIGRSSYFEAHLAIFLVNSSTGGLDLNKTLLFEEDTPAEAKAALLNDLGSAATEISSAVDSKSAETAEPPTYREPSRAEGSAKPPMPYARIKPAYPGLADLLGIAATVDIDVLIGKDGAVQDTKIVRWAGFGLDESVEKAVRSMNWRPAEQNGTFLPMRVLLRYNFADFKDQTEN